MTDQPKNFLIEPYDYWKQYNESIEKLKNDPANIAFDKMCYEVFEHPEMGRKFLEYITNRYLLAPSGTRASATYQIDVLWGEGFKDAFRMIFLAITSHKQRIDAENNKKVEKK